MGPSYTQSCIYEFGGQPERPLTPRGLLSSLLSYAMAWDLAKLDKLS